MGEPSRTETPRGPWDITDAELEIYTPSPCPRCQGEITIDWAETTIMRDLAIGVRRFIPGEIRCRTPRCVDENGSKRVPLAAMAAPERIEGAWRG